MWRLVARAFSNILQDSQATPPLSLPRRGTTASHPAQTAGIASSTPIRPRRAPLRASCDDLLNAPWASDPCLTKLLGHRPPPLTLITMAMQLFRESATPRGRQRPMLQVRGDYAAQSASSNAFDNVVRARAFKSRVASFVAWSRRRARPRKLRHRQPAYNDRCTASTNDKPRGMSPHNATLTSPSPATRPQLRGRSRKLLKFYWLLGHERAFRAERMHATEGLQKTTCWNCAILVTG